MFDRFTPAAREVVVDAQRQARDLRHHEILAEHLLIAVLDDEDPAARALPRLGADPTAVRRAVRQRLRQVA